MYRVMQAALGEPNVEAGVGQLLVGGKMTISVKGTTKPISRPAIRTGLPRP